MIGAGLVRGEEESVDPPCGVPAAPVPSDLHEPRPDLRRCRVDRDGVGDVVLRLEDISSPGIGRHRSAGVDPYVRPSHCRRGVAGNATEGHPAQGGPHGHAEPHRHRSIVGNQSLARLPRHGGTATGNIARMLDHLSIQCSPTSPPAPASTDRGARPTRGRARADFGEVVGYGVVGKPDFWIGPRTTGEGFREAHIAFGAADSTAVQAFFDAAVAAGSEVLHPPRLWPEYHPGYFGALSATPTGTTSRRCATPGPDGQRRLAPGRG